MIFLINNEYSLFTGCCWFHHDGWRASTATASQIHINSVVVAAFIFNGRGVALSSPDPLSSPDLLARVRMATVGGSLELLMQALAMTWAVL